MKGKSQKGFTLIELIVVFTVLAILSTIGVISFVSYSRAQVLNQATNDLVQALNTAKSLSASQLKTVNKNGKTLECLDYQTLNGYGVQINASDTSHEYYALYISCTGNGVNAPETTDPLWQTPLPQNVSFDTTDTVATNIADVFFPVLSGGTTTKGNDNADSIVLTSYGSTRTIRIINGYISVQ